jgi:hypothetical protein
MGGKEHALRAAMAKHLMTEMHVREAADGNAWATTDDGTSFVLRGNKIHKLDASLAVAKSVDLPADVPTAFAFADEDAAPGQPPREMSADQLRQKMIELHSTLPTKMHATADAIFVSTGGKILKFDHDLNLQQQSKLPDAELSEVCRTCDQILQTYGMDAPGQGQNGARPGAADRPSLEERLRERIQQNQQRQNQQPGQPAQPGQQPAQP